MDEVKPSERASVRFGSCTKDELASLVEGAVPKSTKAAAEFWGRVFEDFCKEKRLALDLKTCAVSDMNDVLCQFYKCLRTKAGCFYEKVSCSSARASLGRYVTVDLKRSFSIFQTATLQ